MVLSVKFFTFSHCLLKVFHIYFFGDFSAAQRIFGATFFTAFIRFISTLQIAAAVDKMSKTNEAIRLS
jgi:hypothetical protein